ncbi:MAG: NAD+ synthase [Candidatus Hydrothermae bacterium]|nr:NAD+ synthase [Candidatus Hydrothermae bacterium]
MKIELYLKEKELSLYEKIIVNSIKVRVEKIQARGGVVALSGGIDSSLVAVLAHRALGDNLLCLIMPEKGVSPEEDTEHALKIVNKFNIKYKIIPINKAVEWFSKNFPEGEFKEQARRMAIANTKPRIRMILNYLYANAMGGIVIGTSNKTELLLGYGTKFGDMAADIYPIGDLYKTQVWQLAEHVGIPTEIIRKKPSAGLWKGQTDEEELGHTYYEIDRVLYALVELELSVRETSEFLGIDEEAVLDIYKRVISSEHKRKPPTITRLSKMCLDKDWRYPVERY